jgi:outer membrane protein OmpA-like peptidoglycan-associated protein
MIRKSPIPRGLFVLLLLPSVLGLYGQEVIVRNASRINTADMEFAPVRYENGLIFVSRYRNGPVNPETGETYFELFYSDLDPMGQPVKRSAFSTALNSAYHEGPVSFSRDGSRIFFTRTNSRGNVRRADKKAVSRLKIYEAQRGPFDWENVRELTFNSDDYTCMHPSLAPDGTKLFFASDMPGGLGGLDLYVSEWRNGTWQTPINLGPEINTPKNEGFPFFHESGILFFSSGGHPGRGGLDLYMIDMSARTWGPVLNLGEPFNTEGDDLALTLEKDGKRGYFTSNRPGGYGRDDIYLFEAPNGLQGIRVSRPLEARVTVYDMATSRRLQGSAVHLYELDEQGVAKAPIYETEIEANPEQDGVLNLKMRRKSDAELGIPTTVTDRNGETFLRIQEGKEYLLLVVRSGFYTEEVMFTATPTGPSRPLEIGLRPQDCIDLRGKVLDEVTGLPIAYAAIRIENACNQQVTTLRANIEGEYLGCLEIGCDYTVTAQKAGFQSISSQVSTVRLRGSRSLDANLTMQALSPDSELSPLAPGSVIVLENIYYDFNKSSIRKGETPELDALVKLMEDHPSMVIELGAHTDSRGDDDYNLDLSLQRAESAKDYLVERGVLPARIRAVGYGEAYLRNRCSDGTDCPESEHRINRRTEVKILSIAQPVRVRYENGN